MLVNPARRFFPHALLLAAVALAQGDAHAEEITVRAVRDGEFIVVSASAVMQVDPSIAWAVLSDYDHLARFIPDLQISRVVSRDGNKVRVEQKGDVGFIFYKQPVSVTLEVYEEPQTRISARGIEGNVRGLETRYELRHSGPKVTLDYAGRFDPDFVIPPLIGMPLMRRVFERRFRAMVEEIERRDALAHGGLKQ